MECPDLFNYYYCASLDSLDQTIDSNGTQSTKICLKNRQQQYVKQTHFAHKTLHFVSKKIF